MNFINLVCFGSSELPAKFLGASGVSGTTAKEYGRLQRECNGRLGEMRVALFAFFS